MCAMSIEEPTGRFRSFGDEMSVAAAAYNSVEMELMPETNGDVEAPWGGLEEIVKSHSVRRASVARCATDFLDRIIPLEDASHANVVRYTVEIPTRYARCFAEMTDGHKVPFVKLRKFIGWSGRANKRSFLFRNHGLHIEIQTDSEHRNGRGAPGQVSDVILESAMTDSRDCRRRFIGIDGSQIFLPA